MNPFIPGILFLAVWFVAVPLATARIAIDISKEKIGSSILAWIDRNFHGTPLAYLVRCPICLSHWIIFGFAVLCIPGWLTLPFQGWLLFIITMICVFAAIEITRRLWLKDV